MRRVPVKLLAIPGSHPCAAAEAMLTAKRVPYERIDLIPALSRAGLRATGFGAGTVPALRIEGTRIQGTRVIARNLDARWPEPTLFPADPAARERTEAIEAWADGPLQAVVRRIILWSIVRSRTAVPAFLEGARLQLHIPVALAALPPVAMPVLRLDGALSAADYQIAGSVRRLLAFDDLAVVPADRPAAGLTRRLIPVFPAHVPRGVLPAEWLQ